MDETTHRIADGNSILYVRIAPEGGGHVLVVKVTATGRGLWVTSHRRLSRDEARQDAEVPRLLGKGEG